MVYTVLYALSFELGPNCTTWYSVHIHCQCCLMGHKLLKPNFQQWAADILAPNFLG